jgi:hypothetical protein
VAENLFGDLIEIFNSNSMDWAKLAVFRERRVTFGPTTSGS